jgi:membrane protein required for colicin V production
MPTLNITDLALAIIWLFCSIRGYMRGLVKEVGSLAAIAMGFYCAGTYHKALAPHLTAYISGNYAGTAAYLLIFTVALLGVWFLALAVSGIVKITMTQWADRFFGGGFGLAKGVLITAAILFLIHLASPHPEFLKGSMLVPVLEQISTKLVRFIPPDINEKLRSLGKKAPAITIKPAEDKKPEAAPAQPEKKTAEKPRAETAKPSADKKPSSPDTKKGDPAHTASKPEQKSKPEPKKD